MFVGKCKMRMLHASATLIERFYLKMSVYLLFLQGLRTIGSVYNISKIYVDVETVIYSDNPHNFCLLKICSQLFLKNKITHPKTHTHKVIHSHTLLICLDSSSICSRIKVPFSKHFDYNYKVKLIKIWSLLWQPKRGFKNCKPFVNV